jgi:hypothetical protein
MPHKHPFLENELTLDAFIRDWRDGKLPKAAWTHAAHVAAAAYYAFDHEPQAVYERMKSGILHFNESVGTANTEDSGYHETVTRLWCGIVTEFARRQTPLSRYALACNVVDAYGESRGLHSQYYSFDVLKDRRARREWVAPDLPLPFCDPCTEMA